jgi:hypothetical protein
MKSIDNHSTLDISKILYDKEWIPNSVEEWHRWLSVHEDRRVRFYSEDLDQLIADYRRERQITGDYQGREILELLQNANDAAAEKEIRSQVKIVLSRDGLIVANTGSPFTTGGVQSLRVSDLSPKRHARKALIGQKGLGFRAILNWSKRPLILSGALSLTYSPKKSVDILECLKSENSVLSKIIEKEQRHPDEVILPALAFPVFLDTNNMEDLLEIQAARSIYQQCLSLRDQGYDTVIGMPLDQRMAFEIAREDINKLRPEILLFTENISDIRILVADEPEKVWKVDGDEKIRQIAVSREGIAEVYKWKVFKRSDRVPPEYLDKQIDSLQEYEIIIAVPETGKDEFKTTQLFSFFPTEIGFPFPVICHATLDLEINRKHPQANSVTFFIIGEMAALLAEVAESQADRDDIWCKARVVARSKDLDILMEERFSFKKRLLKEVNEREIVPTLTKQFKKPRESHLLAAEDLSWLPPESFSDVAVPSEDEFIKKLFKELDIKELPYNEFRVRLNSIIFEDIESRAIVIAGLIGHRWLVPTDAKPELLLDEKDIVIKHGARTYLPPLESNKKIDIPEWLNVRFLNSNLRSKLMILLNVDDQRELKQKLNLFAVNEYSLANIASAMIAETRRRIEENPNQKYKHIQDTLKALFNMFPEEEPPKLPETTGLPLPNMMGSVDDARSLYFSAQYSANGDLLESLYGHRCPEHLLAPPENLDLGLKGDDIRLIRFLKWLGVTDLPREVAEESVDDTFLNYVLDSLKYPLKIEEYFTASKKDFKKPCLRKVKTIDHLEGILGADPAAVLTWLAIDGRATRWRDQDSLNGILTDTRGYDRKPRQYKGGLPSYIRWKIQNTPWLPIQENKKEKPCRCMYGARGLEKVFPAPALFKHPLFEKYHIAPLKLRAAWDNCGVLPDVSYLTPEQVVEILLELPKIDSDGKSAKAFYRNLLANVGEQSDWTGPVTIFKENGLLWGKGPDGHKYYPVKDLRHADTDDIPEQLANKIRLVDLPKRVGVEPIDRNKITVEIKEHNVSQRNNDIQSLFKKYKPYLYALRQVRTRQHQEINLFKKLNLVLCSHIESSLSYEDMRIDVSILEPYKWIIKEDNAYILEDPSESASFNSDIFVDSIGAILASMFGIESGGEFARILRCRNNTDRGRLLKRIIGDSDFDLEELKKEFEQVDDIPPFSYPEEKLLKETTDGHAIEEKKTIEAKKDEKESKEPISSEGVKVVKEGHHPGEKGLRQIALRSKTPVQGFSFQTLRRVANGDICEEIAIIFEESEHRWPLKVAGIQGYQGPRCDIISFDSEKGRIEYCNNPSTNTLLIKRLIEVKGRSSEKGAISLKGNELDAARVYAERYYIYRIYEKNDNDYVLLIVNNPIEHKEAIEDIIEIDLSRALKAERYHLTFGPNSENSSKEAK